MRAQTNHEEELARIEGRTSRLEQRNDTTLAKYLADDWVCFGARNLTKEQFIQNLQQNKSMRMLRFRYIPEISSSRIENKNVQVRVFGDTAVVTYVKEYLQTSDPSKFFGEDDESRQSAGWPRWRKQATVRILS